MPKNSTEHGQYVTETRNASDGSIAQHSNADERNVYGIQTGDSSYGRACDLGGDGGRAGDGVAGQGCVMGRHQNYQALTQRECVRCGTRFLCAFTPPEPGWCPECGGQGTMSEMENVADIDADLYASLRAILDGAMEQASAGKGAERHANDNRFEDQPIMQITRLLGDHPVAALAYQAVKKTVESGRLYHIKGADAAERELLGAINYLAATVIRIREMAAK